MQEVLVLLTLGLGVLLVVLRGRLREKSLSCLLAVMPVTRREFPAGCLVHLSSVKLE